MLRTVTVGSSVTIQGIFVKSLSNGKMIVRVGQELFAGTPVPTTS
jgi:hypothetical protein